MLVANTHLATALPAVTTLENSASYAHTVSPFLPQLSALPSLLWTRLRAGDTIGLLELYASTNPVISGLAFSLFLGATVLVSSEINRNWSQIDRLWSLLPTAYIAHLVVWAKVVGLKHERVNLMLAACCFWSFRLTFNYWRRGGYKIGSEDYRWAIVKRSMPDWAFFILNLTFISFGQSVLLAAFALPPAYALLLANQHEPGRHMIDYVHFSIQIALVMVEFVADGQQWVYHQQKNHWRQSGKLSHEQSASQADMDRGFLTQGLWAYSRHPNFAAEQSFWFTVYMWSCLATGVAYSWTGAGFLGLWLVFQSSTVLTEAISAGKYPEYKTYQQAVSKFVPTSLMRYCDTALGKEALLKRQTTTTRK